MVRLTGICLAAFALAGVLFLLARSDLFDSAWARATGTDMPFFEDPDWPVWQEAGVGSTKVFVPAVVARGPLIMTGLPAYANATYRLPVDARPIKGIYRLSFNSEGVPGVESALRVSINGTRRADVILQPTHQSKTVEIELTADELSSTELSVGLSVLGRGPIAKCTPDDSIAAVVKIQPGSGLHLELTEPVKTARDRLALWGGRVPVRWTNAERNAAGLPSIADAARVLQSGFAVRFDSTGVNGAELARLSAEAAAAEGGWTLPAYPIPLIMDESNRGVRRFDRIATWRYRYDAWRLPEKILPATLDLRMTVGPNGPERRYALAVTLNDRLLLTRSIPAGADGLSHSIALPREAQSRFNALEIQLVSEDRDELRCGATTPAFAELLPGTVLRGGTERHTDALSMLRERLKAAPQVQLTGSGLAAPDALAAAKLIAELDPRALRFTDGDAAAHVRIVTGDVASELKYVQNRDERWIVHQSVDRQQGVVAMPLKQAASLPSSGIALLISFDRAAAVSSRD